jgi:3-oxoacyl-(acyl-carrier-protein) synthase
MLDTEISIMSLVSQSALGFGPEASWQAYKNPEHRLRGLSGKGFSGEMAGMLSETDLQQIEVLKEQHPQYRHLDPSVLYAIQAARGAVEAVGWDSEAEYGVNIGSSRGATHILETQHESFINSGRVRPQTSPNSTLGNISSWVAQDLGVSGPVLSHSITCSTALHAVLNGIAWITSGMAKRFLVGGSEAPLTAFTLAQMKALKIYSRDGIFPCRALDMAKQTNTMVLGEGAGMACLEPGRKKGALAHIIGVGYATEPIAHGASMSADGDCLKRSMEMALNGIPPETVDVVVMHAPGTLKGDRAEMEAVHRVFGKETPALTTNKWKLGHTLGTSGILSMELAILMLRHQYFIEVPYLDRVPGPEKLERVLVNAVGFGGNAVSICLERGTL